MLQPVWWILLLAVVGALAIGIYVRNDKGTPVDGGAPMPPRRIVVLTAYLLLFGIGLVFMLVSLTSLEFPQTAVAPREAPMPSPSPSPTPPSGATSTPSPTPTPSPTTAPAATPVVPILVRVFPQVTVGSPPNVRLALYGKNFNENSKVRLDLDPVTPDYYSENLIRVRLEPAHLVGKGSITLDVINPDGAISNAIPVPIEKPIVKLNVFFIAYPEVTREVQLLLLVIFAGALGSYLHAIMSLSDYIAKQQITASWFWWYISRPFLGMAMALVFYAVLRGGFLAGTPADANVVNPFGVLTIGALVGMFSYKAAQKLGEIFDVVFKATVPPQDAAVPIISKLDPESVPVGGSEPVTIKIIGDGLTKVSTVLLDTEKTKPDIVSANGKEASFKLEPKDMAAPRKIKVTAVTSDGGVSEAATLTVADSPPAGEQGQAEPANNGDGEPAGDGGGWQRRGQAS